MKFTFRAESNDSPDRQRIVVEFDAESLTSVTELFEQFVRGAGFYPTGHLEWVEDEEVVLDGPEDEGERPFVVSEEPATESFPDRVIRIAAEAGISIVADAPGEGWGNESVGPDRDGDWWFSGPGLLRRICAHSDQSDATIHCTIMSVIAES